MLNRSLWRLIQMLFFRRRRKSFATWIANILLALMVGVFFTLSIGAVKPELPSKEQPLLLYSNQARQDLGLTLNAALNRAKKSILIVIYTFNDPRLLATLNQRADKGISVQVIYDAKALPQTVKKLSRRVKLFPYSKLGLMHQKIIVIDQEEVWIGTANFTRASLRYHGNLIMGLYHPQLAQSIVNYVSPMKISSMKQQVLSPRDYIVGGQRLEIWALPQEKRGVEHMIELIRSARHSLYINMFTWTRQDFAQEVIAAAKRGVRVEVALDRDQARGCGAKILKTLLDHHIKVRLSQGNALLHYKTMLIDEKTLVTGSANWTKSAFEKNNDLFVVLHQVNAKQKDILLQIFKRANSTLHQAA